MFETWTVDTLWYKTSNNAIINLSELASAYVNECNSVVVLYKSGVSHVVAKYETAEEATILVNNIWEAIKNDAKSKVPSQRL